MAKVAKISPQKKTSPATAKKPVGTVSKAVASKAGNSAIQQLVSNSTVEGEMIVCQAVDRKGEPVMLERWRYELLKQAILNVVPADDIGLMYKQLTPAVRANLSPADRKRIGSLHHDTTLVKLDLESRGELERIEGMRPQYLRRIVKARKTASPKNSLKRG